MSEDEIRNHHMNLQKAATDKFDKMIAELDDPSPEFCEKYKEMLLEKIKRELEEEINRNDVKRVSIHDYPAERNELRCTVRYLTVVYILLTENCREQNGTRSP